MTHDGQSRDRLRGNASLTETHAILIIFISYYLEAISSNVLNPTDTITRHLRAALEIAAFLQESQIVIEMNARNLLLQR